MGLTYVVQQSAVEPSLITNSTVIGSLSSSVGVGRSGPFPFTWMLASSARPPFRVTPVIPLGAPATFL
jgi:hypothetical protein